jgi:hypothetical protein
MLHSKVPSTHDGIMHVAESTARCRFGVTLLLDASAENPDMMFPHDEVIEAFCVPVEHLHENLCKVNEA